MAPRRKAKRTRRRSPPKPPVARRPVAADVAPYDEASERRATSLPPLERDVDSDESTQLGALFDERGGGNAHAVLDDAERLRSRSVR